MSHAQQGARFGRVGVVGLGLLGSSILRALRQRSPATVLFGYDSDPNVRQRALALNLVDYPLLDVGQMAHADLIVICTPVGVVARVAAQILTINPAATVTDVASSKASVQQAARALLPAGARFVPAHPMAGGERGGPDAGQADLFVGKSCLLTPDETTPEDAIELVHAFWAFLGAYPSRVDAAIHDRSVALTSHLPHLLAFALIDSLTDTLGNRASAVPFMGRSIGEQVRLASSEPAVWAHIFSHNSEQLLAQLSGFETRLAEWRTLVEQRSEILPSRLLQTVARARELGGDAATQHLPI